MRFRLIEDLLLEDIAAVKALYPNISDSDFNDILSIDPTYKEGSNSVGKYTKWICNLLKRGAKWAGVGVIEHGMLYPLEDNLAKFDDLKSTLPNKDINQFKTAEEFTATVENMSEDNLTDRQKERRLRKAYNEAELVYSGPTYQMWTPTTYAASCTLGKGTRWCTAYSDDDSYYCRYSEKGPLYIIINKSNPSEKYQFHFETNSFMNAEDTPLTSEEAGKLFDDQGLIDTLLALPNLELPKFSEEDMKALSNGIVVISNSDYISALNCFLRNSNWEYTDAYLGYFYDQEGEQDGLYDNFMDTGDFYPTSVNDIRDSLRYVDDDVKALLREYTGLDDSVSDDKVAYEFLFFEQDRDTELLTRIKMDWEQAFIEGTYDNACKYFHQRIIRAWLPRKCSDDLESIQFSPVNSTRTAQENLLWSMLLSQSYDEDGSFDITGNVLKDDLLCQWFDRLRDIGEPPYYGFEEFSDKTFSDLLKEDLTDAIKHKKE